MARIGQFIVVISILIISASLGLILHLRVGLGLPVSVLSAISVALGGSVLQIVTARNRERARLNNELSDLYHSSDRLIRRTEATEAKLEELSQFQQRLDDLEANIGRLVPREVERQMDVQIGEIVDYRIEKVKNTLVSEMQLIETLVKQMAEGIRSDGRPHIVRDQDEYNVPDENELEQPVKTTPLGHLEDGEVLDMVRQSIEQNKVDLYLQPMVTLPQRKVKFYEALTRLRNDDGEIIFPADYIRVAEPAGIMPMIDNLLLFRSVQVVDHRHNARRLGNPDVISRENHVAIFITQPCQGFIEFHFALRQRHHRLQIEIDLILLNRLAHHIKNIAIVEMAQWRCYGRLFRFIFTRNAIVVLIADNVRANIRMDPLRHLFNKRFDQLHFTDERIFDLFDSIIDDLTNLDIHLSLDLAWNQAADIGFQIIQSLLKCGQFRKLGFCRFRTPDQTIT